MLKSILTTSVLAVFFVISFNSYSQEMPDDLKMYEIIDEVSAERLETDIRKLAGFGTRHTMSDTVSKTRGIGAARRWIKAEFEKISKECGNCLEVYEQRTLVKADPETRIYEDTYVVNIYAIQKGTDYPNRYAIMSGDIDSRASDVKNYKIDAPGANDNATGMAGAIEAARVLSKHKFKSSIIYAGLSGEEQGLYGGKFLAEKAKEEGWEIIGILNNDMIGNIEGVDGVIDNRSFRIFSEPYSSTSTERSLLMKRFYGGENDGDSRQLARFVYETTKAYMPEMNPIMIYRLDRFGRGGHHRPFNELGFSGVRIMEAHENYNRQHQDIRIEDGIAYGDVIEGVNFAYCAKMTAVNAIVLAAMASGPASPTDVKVGGIVQPSAKLSWGKVDGAKGYKVYWRETTSAVWQYSRYVGDVSSFTLEGIVLDNFLFGVGSVGENGYESVIAYPTGVLRN
ncbi:M28 family metallopeptidase [Marinoscillum pacificum]|uniref:M28 family metallopeptidase n=1 Tax=Marinoscillum pacificum TaxID=392723 RepID=UPI0021576A23|nr:M28 family metallopeptidase [Marinoscillum pacificum]